MASWSPRVEPLEPKDDSLSEGECDTPPRLKAAPAEGCRGLKSSPSESEYAYDPYAEQDLQPWERRWQETYEYEPEAENG